MKPTRSSRAPLGDRPPGLEGAGLPPSATRGWVVGLGFVAFVGSLCLVRLLNLKDAVTAALICMGATALANYLPDILVLKVHRRESTGLNWARRSPSVGRVGLKLTGLGASLGLLAMIYWLFPEYRGDFYSHFYELVRRILPWWLLLAVPYFYYVDARQTDPKDGYYHAGLVVAFRWREVDLGLLIQHVLGWLVKAYFIPLMFTYYVGDLRTFLAYDFSAIDTFREFYEFGYFFIFLADVGIACVGYLISLRLFDTHLRSAEPTVNGWLVALLCYQPFWSLISHNYLDYSRDFAWGPWLEGRPALYCLWGSTILALYVVYLWATVIFGCRFSNLTHRGILTNGPYRWTKHPAYIAKTLTYWLIFIPFIVSESVGDSLRRCGLLLLVCGIYYVRARTEEAHLSRDPVYVQYAQWMDRHGLFRWLRRNRSVGVRA